MKQRKWQQCILDLLFPPRCPVCDEPVRKRDGLICSGCEEKLEKIREPICCCCGKPVGRAEQEYCEDCLDGKHFFTGGRALYKYESMQQSLYRFKYGNRQEYAVYYGKEMAEAFSRYADAIHAQALLPVPISRERYHKRGYNQAELLALEMGKRLHIPVLCNLVIRTKNTLPQKGLNALERQKNLKRAFIFAQNDVKLDTIIIIHDIYTTGSTVDAIAGVLLSAGIKKVYYLALALTTG